MVLWLLMAVLAASATAWVTRPLWRAGSDPRVPANDPAAQIYKDQLGEIDADLARGLINISEAEAARAEVGRRLLAHHASRTAADTVYPAPSSRPALVMAVTALMPLAALAFYLAAGQPTLPDQPFDSRTDGAPQQAAAIRAFEQLEDHLADHPADGEGWERIAPVYLRLGRYEAAVGAFEKVVALKGRSVSALSGLARAHIFLHDGRVNDAARKALESAVELEPGHFDNRFWLAVGREQSGDVATAIEDYRRLLSEGPATAPWRELATQRLATAERRLASAGPRLGAVPQTSAPPPAGMPQLSQEQMDAARQLSSGDRQAMIEQMVGRLADRLKSNGQDSEGWQRLVQAYVVLGRKGEATAALTEARRQLAADRDALGQLEQLAQRLGLGS